MLEPLMKEPSEETIKAAFRQFSTDSEIEKVKDISGQMRKTYELVTPQEDSYVCYFNIKDEKQERFKKEEKLIELVNEKTDIPTQQIVYSDFSKSRIPYLFYIAKKIQGSSSEEDYQKLDTEEQKEIVRQIGRYLGELHSKVTFEEFGRLTYIENGLQLESRDSWKELVTEIADDYIEGMRGTRFEDLQEDFKDYVEKNLHLLTDDSPVLVHYDVAVDNILFQDTEVKALLDWERAIVGQPEWDLAYTEVRFILQFFEDEEKIEVLKKSFYSGYKEKRELTSGWKTRKEYFQMIQLFHGLKYFENWTERRGYSEKEKEEEEDWHRRHFRKNNRKLNY